MRTTCTRPIALAAFIWLAVLPLTGCGQASPASAGSPPETDGMVGAWRAKIRFTDGAFAAVKDLEFL